MELTIYEYLYATSLSLIIPSLTYILLRFIKNRSNLVNTETDL